MAVAEVGLNALIPAVASVYAAGSKYQTACLKDHGIRGRLHTSGSVSFAVREEEFELARFLATNFGCMLDLCAWVSNLWTLCNHTAIGSSARLGQGGRQKHLAFLLFVVGLENEVVSTDVGAPHDAGAVVAVGSRLAVNDASGAAEPLDARPGAPREVMSVGVAVVTAVAVV